MREGEKGGKIKKARTKEGSSREQIITLRKSVKTPSRKEKKRKGDEGLLEAKVELCMVGKVKRKAKESECQKYSRNGDRGVGWGGI